MTSYPDAQPAYGQQAAYGAQPGQAPAAPVSRPGTVLAAVIAAIVAGLAAVIDGAIILAGGRDLALDLAAQAVADVTGESADVVKQSAGSLLEIAVEEATKTLQARAIMVIAVGALLLLFGALMRKAALWARILVTLFALVNALVALRVATDVGSGAMIGLAWAAIVVSAVTLVLTWLPANHRYAKAAKA
ncbi:hypothetical protein SAMN05421504_103708 [Amycolatopsis xylanica]|uniref:Uncharacterized protein n=1 Tax=Amycolatopsis xylanica TaxID=589385 RepID=A0A1H3E916_9PSEU|nr:hypothetical protein [Amycolatopsis xylanica]SDX75196.1 hypothetical protein SAMN05421504_103708 [Amycolatopsis xylanica]